jgi:hypothetical protein
VSGLKVTLWELFGLNVWRGYVGMKRTPMTLILWTAVNGLNGVLLGTIFFKSANTQWRSLTGLLFVEVLAQSTQREAEEGQGLRQGRETGPGLWFGGIVLCLSA